MQSNDSRGTSPMDIVATKPSRLILHKRASPEI